MDVVRQLGLVGILDSNADLNYKQMSRKSLLKIDGHVCKFSLKFTSLVESNLQFWLLLPRLPGPIFQFLLKCVPLAEIAAGEDHCVRTVEHPYRLCC